MASDGQVVRDGKIRGVFFDLGGVVFDSPINVVKDFERKRGLPKNSINRAFAISKSWASLERGEIGVSEFCERLVSERLMPQSVTAKDISQIMRALAAALRPRDKMV
uniref:HAD family phosphatase n=1 Tax=Lotharella globosa TaxID=91324 RepID=A0A7S3Y8M9_9EUKA